jgi:hypothetical protein
MAFQFMANEVPKAHIAKNFVIVMDASKQFLVITT